MKDQKTGFTDPQTNKPISKPKRLVLVSLREAYTFFKSHNPGIKIGFAKFAELRPVECVLAGPAGTHSVCVCTTHQNVKLMIEGANIARITAGTECPISTYSDCFEQILCNEPFRRTSCWLGQCTLCSSTKILGLKQYLTSCFQKNNVLDVTYTQWVSTDRSEIRSVTETAEEFISKLCDKLLILRKHSFIARQQSKAFTEIKNNLKEGEILVQGDFAENFKIIVQNASQSFHWNNKQVTIHPFVCYFRNSDGEIKHVSYVPISECNTHDTVAVYMFQEKLIKFLKETVGFDIKKIFYFSDGCAGQYKNCKNFINLCHHESFFGIEAEWHFFATSHGKGACDGVGGIIKRIIRKESLQRLYKNQLNDAYSIFQFLSKDKDFSKSGLTVEYFHQEDYDKTEDFLRDRFSEAITIPGTRKYHYYKPISKGKLLVKEYSMDSIVEIEVAVSKNDIDILVPSNLAGKIKRDNYVTVVYDDAWWLGKVEDEPDEDDMVGVNFFKPAGDQRIRTFNRPFKEDFLKVHLDDVLKVVTPLRERNRTIELSQEDIKSSCELLVKHDR